MAYNIIQRALQYHHDGHSHYFAHFSLGAHAYLLSQHGASLTGIEIYSMLEQQKFVRDSRWFNDLYRDPICALAKKDNPNDMTTSESVGKDMKLWKTLEQIIQQANM